MRSAARYIPLALVAMLALAGCGRSPDTISGPVGYYRDKAGDWVYVEDGVAQPVRFERRSADR